MPFFELRMSCEYTHVVEADDEQEAARIGEDLDQREWESYCWSGIDVEPADACRREKISEEDHAS